MRQNWAYCFVLCCGLCHVGVVLGTEGPLRMEPSYDPFFVLLGAPFSVTCVKDVTCAQGVTPCVKDGGVVGSRSVLWSVNGDPPESWGFASRSGTRTLEGGRVRSFSHLTKDLVSLSDIVPGGLLCHTDVTGEGREEVLVSVNFFNVLLEGPNITEGDDVSLKCAPDIGAKVIWSRDGHVIDNGVGRRLLQDGNRTLVLLDSRPQDSGVYQCRVVVEARYHLHSRETEPQTFVQNISVAGRPYLTEPVTSHISAQLNSTLTLRCPVHGHPVPHVFWLHPGDLPLQPSPRHTYAPYNDVTDAILTMTNVTENDLGIYHCVARNGIGQLSKKFHVGLGVSGALSQHVQHGGRTRVVVVGLSIAVVLTGQPT
ncbi:protein turtle-like [Babylonia areolata]|uniref:protein turtle-like n=1 Tax=Babylonia areolata TaxID=304850 RepID=UPI003FD6B87F